MRKCIYSFALTLAGLATVTLCVGCDIDAIVTHSETAQGLIRDWTAFFVEQLGLLSM